MLILESSFYHLNFKIRGVHPFRAPTAWVWLPNTMFTISPEYDTQSGGGVKNWNCVTTSGVRIALCWFSWLRGTMWWLKCIDLIRR